MSVINLLSSQLNRKDEEPNEALAKEIIQSRREDWIQELVDNLNCKDKNIQSDCLKVLYEIGEHGAPELIAPYYKEFASLLNSKNNRLVWGAMTALDTITLINPDGINKFLPEIMEAIQNGSVITVDHGVGILVKLSGIPEYSDRTFPLLIEQLEKCAPKQLPMYAEKSLNAINKADYRHLIALLELRLPDLEKESQKKRINKVLKKLNNNSN